MSGLGDSRLKSLQISTGMRANGLGYCTRDVQQSRFAAPWPDGTTSDRSIGICQLAFSQGSSAPSERAQGDRRAEHALRGCCVAHVVLSLAPGGTERLVIELSKRSGAARGVICLDAPGPWATELTDAGIPVVSLGRRPGFRPSVGWRVARAARQLEARILHCHHYSPFVYGRLAALVAPHLRLVFTEHGRLSDARPSLKRRMVNPLLARFQGSIHAVSHDLKTHMIAEGFPADRIDVVHNGVDPGRPTSDADVAAARARLNLSADHLVVGTIGRLDLVKDFETLLHAAAMLRDRYPTLRLVVIGDGPERDRLRELAGRLELNGTGHFTGHRDEARELLPAFDIYVNSSISEGISLTILEAMAASRPIVATAVGGTPEVVQHGVTGLLVQSRSAADLATAIAKLLNSATVRKSMGESGRRLVEREFSLTRMIGEYVRIYESVERI